MMLLLALSLLACTDKTASFDDADGDGYTRAEDCDDYDASVNPGAPEVCGDGVDNDCDGADDEGPEWFFDADGDGFGDPNVVTEACEAPEGTVDNSDDCDDADLLVHPGASELCDGVDADCDGVVDESPLDGQVFYGDEDGDGYAGDLDTVLSCAAPVGYQGEATDCDDTDFDVHPHATEIPMDGVDQTCDGEDLCHDLNCDDYPDIVIGRRDGQGIPLEKVILYGGAGQGAQWTWSATTLGGSYGRAHHVEDLDSDGYLDMVTWDTHVNSSTTVDIDTWWGDGTQSFARTDTVTGYQTARACFADVNGDQVKDIIAANKTGSTSSIFLSAGASFTDSSRLDLPTTTPNHCLVVDLDNDGTPGLVFSSYVSSGSGNDIFFNVTAAGWTDHVSLQTGLTLGSVAGDLDGDGVLELVFVAPQDTQGANSPAQLAWGPISGGSTSDTLGSARSYDAAVADFNGDGLDDVLTVSRQWGGGVTDVLSLGDGTQDVAGWGTQHLTSKNSWSVQAADLNLDGLPDAVIASACSGGQPFPLRVHVNDPSYPAAPLSPAIELGSDVIGVAIGDVDGDGYPDLLAWGDTCGQSSEALETLTAYWGSASGYSGSNATTLGQYDLEGIVTVTVVGG
ncbi:MAG: VCBS repeat-containing protein [Alphaproteobacteria bacterium]|nr:VCBS repeat-containing protein [Alphaproteobacteria bacterium]